MARVSCCALARRLWSDEGGFIISTELVLIASILVIGLIVGLTQIRDQVVLELNDVASAFSNLDQSFSFGNVLSPSGSTNGSQFGDQVDAGDDTAGMICVTIGGVPSTGDTP